MNTPRSERVNVKFQALNNVVSSPLDEARKMLLATVINRYMPLDEAEEAEFAARVQATAEEGGRQGMAVLDINRVYEIIREDAHFVGLEEGRAKGREEGREEGRAEGAIDGKRESVLRLLHLKFGEIPAETLSVVRSLQTPEQLDSLIDRVFSASELAEVGLAGQGNV